MYYLSAAVQLLIINIIQTLTLSARSPEGIPQEYKVLQQLL